MTEDESKTGRVTEDLTEWLEGDAESGDRSLRFLFPRILKIARRLLSKARRATRPEPAELASEGLIRLLNGPSEIQSREHFLSLLALHMRNSLIDQHRAATAVKRNQPPEASDELLSLSTAGGKVSEDVLMVREVLDDLATKSPRTVDVVSLRLQFGFSIGEIAAMLGVSKRTVNSEWTKAQNYFRKAFDRGST